MGEKLRKRIAVNELMVLLCVLVMLASVAIPSYMQFQRHARVEGLMKSAKNCKSEMASWIARPVSQASSPKQGPLGEKQEIPSNSGTQPADIHAALTDFARYHNHSNPNPFTRGPLLSMESVHTSPVDCPRDGTIHIIPLVNKEDTVYGATLAVTNLVHRGGPKNDGLLATFRVLPDREGRVSPTPEGR